MAKRAIKWTMAENNTGMTVKWLADDTRVEFVFADIKDYVKPSGVTFELFRHGLKQKLADSIAGMAKQDGITTSIMIDTMLKVWDAIVLGEFSTRRPATPKFTQADIRKKVDAKRDELEAMGLSTEQVDAIVDKLFG